MTEEEQKSLSAVQSSCNHTFPNDAADRRLHENGLIGELLTWISLRHGLENVGHGRLHARRN